MFSKYLHGKWWKTAIYLLDFVILALVVWFIYNAATDIGPRYFPLNDAQAEYRITINCPNGQGWVEQIPTQGSAYCLDYRGNNVVWKEDHNNSNFFRITIGKSDVDLKTYINRKVKNIKGKYALSSEQCIQGNCTDIYGPLIVVNIDGLESAD